MKSLKKLLIFSVFCLSFSACHKESLFGIYGTGNDVSEIRPVSGFSKVELSMSANVYYLQDSVYYVEVSAQHNILPIIETEVRGATLTIGFKSGTWIRSHRQINITVHSPAMNGLAISGSGNINVQSNISTDDIELKVSGSGNISAPTISAQTIRSIISGSGDINISGGSSINESCTISGSGDIDAGYVIADVCTAKISGSGDMTVNVQKALSAHISGSGDIKYRGVPTVDAQISGSGKIMHIN